MIIQDLEHYDIEKPILLEGAAYLPELVSQCNADPKKVIYMVPTKEFQLHHYRQREWIHHILKECDDPKQAFTNWMMRDQQFGQEILRQAEVRNYETILVDGKKSVDEQYEKVRTYFRLN